MDASKIEHLKIGPIGKKFPVQKVIQPQLPCNTEGNWSF